MSYVMKKRVGVCWFYKRHYEALAAVMQETKPGSLDLNRPQAAIEWAFVCTKLADMLQRDNASFKRERFLRACEPGANVRARS